MTGAETTERPASAVGGAPDVLEVENLSVVYPGGHRALDGVSLRIGPGQRWAVVGRSGSGKTTLVRAVLGLLPPGTRTSGRILVAGQDVLAAAPAQLRAMRGRLVGYVPQDPYAAHDPLRRIAHHVAEAWTAHRMRPPPGAVSTALGTVGIPEPGRRAAQYPHQWSGGMLQRASLVAAGVHAPLLTLADEPTSAVDAELADEMLALLGDHCAALLLISHDLSLVARHTEGVLVLSSGRIVERGPVSRLVRSPATAQARRLVAAATVTPRPARPPAHAEAGPSPDPGPAPVAEVVAVSRRYGRGPAAVSAVREVSLAVRAGEVVGVVGPSGSGKSTLARLVGGMERPDTGTVRLGGERLWTNRNGTRRSRTGGGGRRAGFVMPVFQDPVASLDRRWSLWRTLTEPLVGRGRRLPRSRRRKLAAHALERVGLDGVDPNLLPGELSVGQCQRVGLARALMARPALLIADEPTASLDVVSAAAITELLRRLADEGMATLVVSHDEPRLAGYASRVERMKQGSLNTR